MKSRSTLDFANALSSTVASGAGCPTPGRLGGGRGRETASVGSRCAASRTRQLRPSRTGPGGRSTAAWRRSPQRPSRTARPCCCWLGHWASSRCWRSRRARLSPLGLRLRVRRRSGSCAADVREVVAEKGGLVSPSDLERLPHLVGMWEGECVATLSTPLRSAGACPQEPSVGRGVTGRKRRSGWMASGGWSSTSAESGTARVSRVRASQGTVVRSDKTRRLNDPLHRPGDKYPPGEATGDAPQPRDTHRDRSPHRPLDVSREGLRLGLGRRPPPGSLLYLPAGFPESTSSKYSILIGEMSIPSASIAACVSALAASPANYEIKGTISVERLNHSRSTSGARR